MEMPNCNLDSWNGVIGGLVADQQLEDALRLWLWMPERDMFSWNSILLGLVRSGFVVEAHVLFEKSPWNWEKVDAAMKLFRMMPHQDVTSWNATIFGLGKNDLGEKGLKLFLEMISKIYNPDTDTFAANLNI